MDTQLKVAFITGFFGLLSPLIPKIWGKIFPKSAQTRINTTRSNIYVQAATGGSIGVLFGYFLVSQFFVSACPPFARTSVSISSPVVGSSIPRLITVQGTACHISKNDELWLLVVPAGVSGYYPQMAPIVISDDGSWSASAYAGLDSTVDVGKGFILIAAIADQQGGAAIRTYLSQSRPDFKGLDPLPQGIRLMTQVRVIRK